MAVGINALMDITSVVGATIDMFMPKFLQAPRRAVHNAASDCLVASQSIAWQLSR